MRRPSPATVLSVIALVVASAGVATAARPFGQQNHTAANGTPFITGFNVKDGSLTPADFSGSVRGPTGPAGPSNAIVRKRPNALLFPVQGGQGAEITVLSVPVPAGSYVLLAKASIVVSQGSSASDFFRCRLLGGNAEVDQASADVGPSGGGVVQTVSLVGSLSSPSAFTGQLRCWHDHNLPPPAANYYVDGSADLAAIQTGHLG